MKENFLGFLSMITSNETVNAGMDVFFKQYFKEEHAVIEKHVKLGNNQIFYNDTIINMVREFLNVNIKEFGFIKSLEYFGNNNYILLFGEGYHTMNSLTSLIVNKIKQVLAPNDGDMAMCESPIQSM